MLNVDLCYPASVMQPTPARLPERRFTLSTTGA